jgi:hypothetical protein
VEQRTRCSGCFSYDGDERNVFRKRSKWFMVRMESSTTFYVQYRTVHTVRDVVLSSRRKKPAVPVSANANFWIKNFIYRSLPAYCHSNIGTRWLPINLESGIVVRSSPVSSDGFVYHSPFMYKQGCQDKPINLWSIRIQAALVLAMRRTAQLGGIQPANLPGRKPNLCVVHDLSPMSRVAHSRQQGF